MEVSRKSAIAVAIVDDEALIRQGLSLILAAAPDLQVVGSSDGIGAVELVETTEPDVLLLDIRMPVIDGLTVMRTLKRRGIATTVVILTTFDADEHVETAMKMGASGFLLKDTDPEQLPSMIRAAAGGGVVLDPAASRRLLTVRESRVSTEDSNSVDLLTSRERSVLRLLAAGASNAEIGTSLHLSVGTIKDHVSSLLAKLGVATRVQAALIAERAGLLNEETR